MGSWMVDSAGLEQARNILGLKLPVAVRIVPRGPNGMAGKYHGLGCRGGGEPQHYISLNGGLGPIMANTALWHELTHAMQCERFLPDGRTDENACREANNALWRAFHQEMKEIRFRTGGSKHNLTMAYADASFEKEAQQSTKLADKHTIIASDGGAVESLLDEKGRKTYRVDLWRDLGWNKQTKERELDFVTTMYVVAKNEWDAKKFVREEKGMTFQNSTCESYQIRPFGKEGNDNE